MPAYPNEILKCFRANEDGRYELTQTFVVDGYRYAGDGFVCARMRCDEPDTEGRWPDVAALKWSAREYASVPIPLPAIETIPPDPPEEKCTCCDGSGEMAPGVECPMCDHGMRARPMPAMKMDDIEIALDHVRLLSAHDATLFAPINRNTPGYAQTAYFKIGDEIEGLIAVCKSGHSVIVEPITPTPATLEERNRNER